MKQVALNSNIDENDKMPIPLIVAKKWHFVLEYIETPKGLMYSFEQWLFQVFALNPKRILQEIQVEYPEIAKQVKGYKLSKQMGIHYYADEETLIHTLSILSPRYKWIRIIEVRNYIASLSDKYFYLKSIESKPYVRPESKFQSALVLELSTIMNNYELYQDYPTLMGKRIDILAVERGQRSIEWQPSYLLIECKIRGDDIYKAVGQVMCYWTEISQEVLTDDYVLAIAMPYKSIDDYMREITTKLSIRLISIRHGQIIDGVSSQLITSADDLFATGKRLLANG